MTRNKMLLAVAATALIAGSSALAQEHRGQENRGSAAQHQNEAPAAQHQGGNAAAQHQNGSPAAQQQNRGEKSETTGQAPQERSSTGNKSGAEEKSEKSEPRGQERSNRGDRERPAAGQNERREDRSRSTTGQGTPQGQPNERRNDNTNRDRDGGVDRDRTTIDRDRVQGGERNDNRTTNEGRSGGGAVNLSAEQRTRIHEVIVKERAAPRVNNVDFALSVGTAVPRSIRLVAVPTTLVEIEPRWRGFEYFLVGDEIVIVDPRRMEIVAVVPA
jgi:hypothetical protein